MANKEKLTSKQLQIATAYFREPDCIAVAEALHMEPRQVVFTLEKPKVRAYIADLRRGEIADREEILWWLTAILRGQRREAHVKAVHKKDTYFDTEGRRCQRDDEVLEMAQCDAKISDLWRVADLICKLDGLTNADREDSTQEPVIISGEEALE